MEKVITNLKDDIDYNVDKKEDLKVRIDNLTEQLEDSTLKKADLKEEIKSLNGKSANATFMIAKYASQIQNIVRTENEALKTINKCLKDNIQAQLSSDKPQFWLRFWLVMFDNLGELLIWTYHENLVKIGLLV